MFCGVERLSQPRVDEDVEEVADERQRSREDVHGTGEQREGERRERETELEGVLGRKAVGCDGPPPRPLAHQPVDVAIEHVVERARAAAGEREADHRRHGDVPGRQAARTGDEAAEAGDEQQRHDRGFVSAT